MWADLLIGCGIAALLGVAVVVYRLRGGGPAERRRARAVIEATTRRHAPMKPAEAEHAAEIHALVEEYRTGELPKIVEPRKPTVRDLARKYRRPAKHGARKVPRSRRFDPLTGPVTGPMEKAVMLPGRQPQLLDLGGFTEEWRAGDVDRMVAKAKAGAR